MLLRILGILLTVLLSQGFHWSRLMQEKGWLDGKYGLVVAIALTALLVVQQIWLSRKKLASQDDVTQRSEVVNVFLDHMVAKYYEILGAPSEAKPVVRANVMLPTTDRCGLRTRLKICYAACPPGIQYSPKEWDLLWSKDCGVVGWVWKRCKVMTGNTAAPDIAALAEKMTVEQKDAVAHLKSVHSVPIHSKGRILGVLSLDGGGPLAETKFDSLQVTNLVNYYAGKLTSQCFDHGVKG